MNIVYNAVHMTKMNVIIITVQRQYTQKIKIIIYDESTKKYKQS